MTVTGIIMDNVMISGSDTVTYIGGSDVDDVAANVVNGLDVVISGSNVAFAIVIDDGVELSSVLHCT